jgi:proline racemase
MTRARRRRERTDRGGPGGPGGPGGGGGRGRLAIHYARGEIGLGEPVVIESIIGSRFGGRVVGTTTFGPYPAVIPEVEGAAHITGRHEFLIDPGDPLRNGFILR